MRKYRQLTEITKQRISNSMKGKNKSVKHKQAISEGLKRYWKTVPNKPVISERDIIICTGDKTCRNVRK